jgi:dCTP deaminase
MKEVWLRVELLRRNITPNEMIREEEERLNEETSKGSLSELALILNSGWFYWITFSPKRGQREKKRRKFLEEYERVNRLILKALQSCYMQNEYIKRRKKYLPKQTEGTSPDEMLDAKQLPPVGGVLSRREIIDRLHTDIRNKRLIITPILDPRVQIHSCSIDIRLGNEFIVTRRTKVPSIDPASPYIESKIEQYQSKIYVPLGKALTIHPHQFVLGSTLEYLGMPVNLCAIVVGRSSWGRLGLVIATATKIDPNFKGCITLELVNEGDVPIELYPAARVGQLIIYNTSSPAPPYKGKHEDTPTEPGFSRIYKDDEWKFLFKS